ncbi:unnamed protein product [Lampetra fluviatilis]
MLAQLEYPGGKVPVGAASDVSLQVLASLFRIRTERFPFSRGFCGATAYCRREEETRSGVTLQEASALRARRGSSAGGRRSDGSRVGERDAEPGARRLVWRCRLVPLVPLARRWDAMSDVSHRVPESPFEGAVPKRCPARLGN